LEEATDSVAVIDMGKSGAISSMISMSLSHYAA
jgi:D-arabinose 5-phosphate isomerase GutQ